MNFDRVLNLSAPAKINLFLELKSKRSDGFHELETIMTTVDLCDELSFQARPDDTITIEPFKDDLLDRCADLPPVEENLIYHALMLLKQKGDLRLGMKVKLRKRIPAQAGLGGASSDAATALLGGNELWDLRLNPLELHALAEQLGSDVPFFLDRGMARCTGRGEKIERLNCRVGRPILIARPPFGLSTPKVYKHCSIPSHSMSSKGLEVALLSGDPQGIGLGMGNRLEAPATQLNGFVGQLRLSFEELGCLGHQLSGSGSCYFGIFPTWNLMRNAANRLLQRLPDLALYCCREIVEGMTHLGPKD